MTSTLTYLLIIAITFVVGFSFGFLTAYILVKRQLIKLLDPVTTLFNNKEE